MNENLSIGSFLNNSFSDLLNVTNEECTNSRTSVLSLLRIFENEMEIKARYDAAQKIIIQLIHTSSMVNLEQQALQSLLPGIENLFSDILESVCRALPDDACKEKSIETFHFIQDYLQISINTLKLVDNLVEYILKDNKFELVVIQSIPLNIEKMVFLTFQHCKESNKLYKMYFEDLKEILMLFNAAQEVYDKLLMLLELNTVLDLFQDEIGILQDVLNLLSKIGEVLIDMNLKALANTWKGYMFISQRFSNVLNEHSFNISYSLTFLSSALSTKIDSVLKMAPNDIKEINHTLKLCNFFTKIISKLCDIYWPSLENHSVAVLEFLLSVYNYYPPFLQFKGFPENVVCQVISSVFSCVDTLLEKLLYKPDFFKVLYQLKVSSSHSSNFLFLLTSICQKLPSIICHNNQLSEACDIENVIKLFFHIIKNSYLELFWNIVVHLPSYKKQSIYDINVINICLLILLLNEKQYKTVEVILFENIFETHIWNSLLATDIWTIVLKNKHPNLMYATICNIIVKIEFLLSEEFTSRNVTILVKNLLKQLFIYLPEEYKQNLIKKYPIANHLYVWKAFGIGTGLNAQNLMTEILLLNIVDKIETFSNGKCSKEILIFLCNIFESIEPVTNCVNVKQLLMSLTKLWNFETKDILLNTIYFKYFIRKLLRITGHFILEFTSEQLLLILMKMNDILSIDVNIKIEACEMLDKLITKSICQSQEQEQITSTESEIFRILLSDINPIIRQNIIEIFFKIVNNASYKGVVQNTMRNDVQLQRLMTNFIQKTILNKGTLSSDEYFKLQKDYIFHHECPDFTIPSIQFETENIQFSQFIPQKKIKIDFEDINLTIERIKGDVELLHKLCGQKYNVKENVTEIVSILNRQLNCNF